MKVNTLRLKAAKVRYFVPRWPIPCPLDDIQTSRCVSTITIISNDINVLHHSKSTNNRKHGGPFIRGLSPRHSKSFISQYATKVDIVNPRTMTDFFGEPLTFFTRHHKTETDKSLFSTDKVATTMAHVDSFLLSAVSKGKLAKGGGDNQGSCMVSLWF